MLVIVDKYIPFINGVIEPYAEVRYLEPEKITPASIKYADALIIRTRTRCNKALLQGSNVRFIATATIGYDHIDTDYCSQNNIFWTNSPGCNAQGVCDYVEEALKTILHIRNINQPQALTIGIVGVGHVGSLVVEMAQKHGFQILLSDPPKKIGISIDEIAEKADIITFHTPLTKSGKYPTWHMFDSDILDKCKSDIIIINAARGGIVNEEILLKKLNKNNCQISTVIDTWEGEPKINKALLEKVTIGSYHIAGYTLQGKINATNACLEALSKYFSLPILQIPKKTLPLQHKAVSGWLLKVDQQLRSNPNKFEILRETYQLR